MVDIQNTSGSTIFSTPINTGCKRKFTLMKEDYVTLKFSLSNPVIFKLGSWFSNEHGTFEVVDVYKPEYNTKTGGWDYELRLDAYYWKWKNKIFKFTPETGGSEASWSLTANLSTHMGIFIRNLTALGYTFNNGTAFSFSIDSTMDTSAKMVSYDNTNLIDALTDIANTWECEWWVFDNIIHFGKCEFGDAVNYQIGVNVESMSRSKDSTDYATRIIAFGSDRNIPSNYRPVDGSVTVNGVVQKRLMLPVGTPYLDAYEGMPEEEAVESIVVFDEIYPSQQGVVSSITQTTGNYTDSDGNNTGETYPIFTFKDTSLKNFLAAWKLDDLRIKFSSGLLNGFDFVVELKDSDNTGTTFEISRNQDSGRYLPDGILYPVVGDTYNMYGYDISFVSSTLISQAEQALLAAAQDYIAKSKIDPSTYDNTMMSDYVYNEGNPLSLLPADILGQKVNLINQGYFESGRISRIIGVEYNLDKPYDSPIITVGESVAYTRFGNLEAQIDSITYKTQTYLGSGNGVYLIRSNDSTAPSESNAFSSKRAKLEFLSKINPDTVAELISFIKGLDVGTYSPGTLGGGGTFRMKDGNSLLEVDKMVVRKDATFRTWIVQEVIAQGGEIVISAANPIKCTSVSFTEDGYRCFFDTGDGQATNTFHVGDQARCQIFTGNRAKYYWRLVTAIGANYIDLSGSDKDGDGVPAAGDNIIQLGNRTDASRQKALVLSAISSDFLAQYEGINTYSLVGRRKTHIGSTSEFVGTVKFSHNGEEVDLGTWASGTESSIQDIKVGTINLIRNADFSKGLDFWDYNNYGDVVPESQFGNVLETDNSWTIGYEVLRPAGVEFCWSVWIKSTVSQTCTITVNSESYNVVLNTSWQKFSGKHISNGSSYTSVLSFQAESPSDYISIAQPFYAEGNRPGNFSISPQDLDDKIGTAQGQADAAKTAADNLAYLRELIDSSTEIDGGRVLTALLGARNLSGVITAFINGLSSLKNAAFAAGVENFGTVNESYKAVINHDGSVKFTDGEFEGKIITDSGSIGGFSIANGRIGSEASVSDGTGQGLSLYDSFIKYSGTNTTALIGKNVLPASSGLVAVGKFLNTNINAFGKNFGLIIECTGAGQNIAIQTKGDIQANGMVLGYAFTTNNPNANTFFVPSDYSLSLDTILMKFTNSNSGIVLPAKSSIASRLGIASTVPFKLKIIILVSADSTTSGLLYGRTTAVSGVSSTDYPQYINTNGDVVTDGLSLARGDSVQFMLIWDGSTYRAYLIALSKDL
jgi:hypothetical protein